MVKISRKLGIALSPFDILKGTVKYPCRIDQQLSEKFLEETKARVHHDFQQSNENGRVPATIYCQEIIF